MITSIQTSCGVAYYSKVVFFKKLLLFSDLLYIAHMETLAEIVKRRSSPGVLVFDAGGELLYSNHEALEMIASLGGDYPGAPGHGIVLPAEITALCQDAVRKLGELDREENAPLPHAVLFCKTGQGFSLRAFMMGDHGKGEEASTHIMILMERIVEKREVDFDKAEKVFSLSRRETEVLKLICQGNGNREIAANLFICEDTVKGHIKKIMQKMRVNSRSEIIVALK